MKRRGFMVGAMLAGLLCACSAPPLPPPAPLEEITTRARPTGAKVALIGIDGATWSILRPLAAAGRLPNFSRLIDEGAHGVLESERPMLSPAIWTSIATGRSRAEHGIESFTREGILGMAVGNLSLVRSTDRQVPALWNLTGLFGLSTGVQGWWASWPAEQVSGWVISDRLPRTRWGEWTEARRDDAITHPPGLARQLEDLIVDPANPPMEEIGRLVQLTQEEMEEFHAAQKPLFGHSLSVFKFAYCAQRSHEEISLAMLARGQPDLLGIFLVATDPISHTFWHHHEPGSFEGVDREEARRLGKLVSGIYEHNDAYLGRLLDALAPDTSIIIVSDHGFQASGKLPQERSWLEGLFVPFSSTNMAGEQMAVGQSGKHHLSGIFIAHGPHISGGVTMRARIFDVAPTILALLGLPVPDDTDGRVLAEILDPGFLSDHPVTTIPSYDPYLVRRNVGNDVDDEQLIESLRSLGYID